MKGKIQNILLTIFISLTIVIINNYINSSKETKITEEKHADTITLFDSSNVNYDNGNSGISSNNVQDAIDELYGDALDYSSINTRLTAVEDYKNQIYPVGSIYISVDSTNPSTLFGGTWVAFGTGKTLVGIDTNDTDFDTVEESHGTKSVTIETANLPSHTHTVTAAGSVGAHTHTTTDYYANTNSGSTTINFSNGYAKLDISTAGWIKVDYRNVGNYSVNWYHKITMPDNSAATSSATGDAINLGGSQAHTHTVSNTNTSRNSGSTTPTFTGTSTNTSAVGSASPTAISTMDPYITVYMWKRTA